MTSGHYENYRENMFFVQPHEGEEPPGAEADELPGAHAPVRLPAPLATATCRSATRSPSTLHRDERGGTLHGLLRVKHITQDDAHVFVTEEQIQDEIDGDDRLRATTSTSGSA